MRRGTVLTLAAALCLAVAGCAAPAPGAGSGTTPAPAGQVVLQLRSLGGFAPLGRDVVGVPALTVYADGLEIGEGPTPSTGPGPALPTLLERRVAPDHVRDLVARAVATGALDLPDLGTPGVADATTERITVTTSGRTVTRDVYALDEDRPVPGGTAVDEPTPEQEAARARLRAFVDSVTTGDEAPGGGPHAADWRPWTAERVTAVARPWDGARPGGGSPRSVPWPGPPLPGAATAQGPDCALATGDAAAAVLTAARTATVETRWTTDDGRAWRVLLRPLLPSESGCADLGR